ncbi:hypothetical protein HF1_08090 [Mycoplasma haemofelis str. Langford 1]|uniref:Uncharacterized protein n=1 Tax=Mycoplasma haemofelis (strain Langford 1) TaxID=941640 RepID=E8ZI46_MYCHL|nr:hypothetical protein [Mycoplasma haemofelis]CBY92817.1 hypothetical protein HF1_08090 [Mycoplasma haemofelis str. Langford 1]
MSYLSSLIKLSPVVAAPAVGGGIFATNFQDTKTQDTLELEILENELKPAPESPKPLPQGRPGRKWEVSGVQPVYSASGGSGSCHIYVLADHEDLGGSLIFRSSNKYNNLEEAEKSIQSLSGHIENKNHITCNNKKWYLYKKFNGGWTFKVGDQEPVEKN